MPASCCVCMCVYLISLGSEGNALYPVLSSLHCMLSLSCILTTYSIDEYCIVLKIHTEISGQSVLKASSY